MSATLTIVLKELALFRRNRAAVAVTFLVPTVLIYIFGWVFGLNRKDTGPSGIHLAVVNASTNPAATKLIDALRAEKAFYQVTTTTNPADPSPTSSPPTQVPPPSTVVTRPTVPVSTTTTTPKGKKKTSTPTTTVKGG